MWRSRRWGPVHSLCAAITAMSHAPLVPVPLAPGSRRQPPGVLAPGRRFVGALGQRSSLLRAARPAASRAFTTRCLGTKAGAPAPAPTAAAEPAAPKRIGRPAKATDDLPGAGTAPKANGRRGAAAAPPAPPAPAVAEDAVALRRRHTPAERTAAAADYDAGRIQVLEGLEPVRKRPGMYIGSTGSRGLHQLLYEILDNAVDEVQAGYGTRVDVALQAGGWVCVTDDGRGIPTDTHPATGKSALETVLTVLHAGGKFGGDSSGYRISGGLHGVGLSVVNALAERLEVTVWRAGVEHTQEYSRGVALGPLVSRPVGGGGPAPPVQGTRVRFLPDLQVMETRTLSRSAVETRLRELAFLNAAATLTLSTAGDALVDDPASPESIGDGGDGGEAAPGSWLEFHYPGGLLEYVTWMNRAKAALCRPLSFSGDVDGVRVEVAMQWAGDVYSDNLCGYVNSIRTPDGGTHLDGFKSAVGRAVNAAARKLRLLKEGEALAGEYIREGLAAVVSVQVESPEFEGQTKTRLGNPSVRRAVDALVGDRLAALLDASPEETARIVAKGLDALRVADAAKRARDFARKKGAFKVATLPGKLADCAPSVAPRDAEIFIVEGESAGGSAKQARDRRFQAILPLRGKILNVERTDDKALYNNAEISSLIVALGLGLKASAFDLSALRYHKIIILTDADVDGAHIRTLLLTFLFRYQRELFERGHVYVGVPPLYKLEGMSGRGGAPVYAYDEAQKQALLAALPPTAAPPTQQRFKGLGEMMPLQLWQTTMDPATRTLRRLTLEDLPSAEAMIDVLMGSKVAPRRAHIELNAPSLRLEDLDL